MNVILEKRKQPSTEKIKYTKNNKLVTLSNGGKEKLIVPISRIRPLRFLTNFNRRVTLNTLKILIN